MDNLAMEHSMRLVVLLILVAHLFFIAPGFSVDGVEQRRPIEVSLGEIHMQPIGEIEYRVIEADIDHARRPRRRRLAPYQLCLPCKCCTTTNISNNTFCATMPCCFGIDCQLPDKPFGVCAFLPKTCNCTSCATAT